VLKIVIVVIYEVRTKLLQKENGAVFLPHMHGSSSRFRVKAQRCTKL